MYDDATLKKKNFFMPLFHTLRCHGAETRIRNVWGYDLIKLILQKKNKNNQKNRGF